VSPLQLAQICGEQCYWGTIREHYKRGLNTRKVCAEKAARIKMILLKDPEIKDEICKIGDAES